MYSLLPLRNAMNKQAEPNNSPLHKTALYNGSQTTGFGSKQQQ